MRIKEIRNCVFCRKSLDDDYAYMSREDSQLYDLYKDKDGNENKEISVICHDCWKKVTKFFKGAYKAGMLDIENYKDVIDRHKTDEEWEREANENKKM